MDYTRLGIAISLLLVSSVSGQSNSCGSLKAATSTAAPSKPQAFDFHSILGSSPFTGASSQPETSGFLVSNDSFSQEMNKVSCANREMAIHLTMSLNCRQRFDVVKISDSNLGVLSHEFSLSLDNLMGVIQLRYIRLGQPHIESIPFDYTEIALMRFYQVTFVISGNVFIFIVNCKIVHSVTIAAPDMCFSQKSGICVGSLNSAAISASYRVQPGSSGVVFGPKGYMEMCPNLKHECSTCAESLSQQQRIRELEGQLQEKMSEIGRLQEMHRNQVGSSSTPYFLTADFFEHFKQSEFVDRILLLSPEASVGEEVNKDKCLINNNPVPNGNFFTYSFPSLQDANCMCFFGTVLCENGVQRMQTLYQTCYDTSTKTSLPANTFKVIKLANGLLCTLNHCDKNGNLIKRAGGPPSQCGSPLSSSDCITVRESGDNGNIDDLYKYRKLVCCDQCNPCDGHPCPDGSRCEANTFDGNHTCVCPPGQHQVGDRCDDLNECLDPAICPSDSVCVDEQVGHRCNCTRPGYFWNNSTNLCEDIDECVEGSVDCPPFSSCQNQEGSYSCVCQFGYHRSTPSGQCQPLCTPECRNEAICTFPGSCICLAGFTGSQCETDLNECDRAPCGANEDCLNIVGSYRCICKLGYERQNGKCININECVSPDYNTCVSKNRCQDTDGGFTCQCNKGGGVLTDCSGMCSYRSQLIPNGHRYTNQRCKQCVCLNGNTVCDTLPCNCSDPLAHKDSCCRRFCMSGCTLPDGKFIERGYTGLTRDGCISCHCPSNRVLNCTRPVCPDVSHCPANLTVLPEGGCCPECEVPKCGGVGGVSEGSSASTSRGCRKCTCKGGEWSCTAAAKCPVLSCSDEDQVYHPGQCCPTCRELPTLQQASEGC